MFIGKLAIIGMLGAISVQAQMTNTTLLGILNTTQLSPANKFMELLKSNKQYKPILDLLSNPGNHTVFVPSDKAFDEMAQQNATTNVGEFSQQNGSGFQQAVPGEEGGDQNNPDNNPSNQQEGSGSQEPVPGEEQGQQQFANAFYAILPDGLRSLQQQQQNQTNGGGNQTSSNGGNQTSDGNQTYNPFTEGARANFTVLNLMQYHIVNGSYLLKDLNDSSVLHTDLTNQTVDKNHIGMPLLITRHNITVNSTQNSTGEGQGSQQSQITVLQQNNGTASSTNGTSSGNNTQTVYHAGNGVEFSNVTLYDIKASNGILHVVDRVLIPPGKPTEVIQNVTNTSTLAQLVQQNNQSASQINNMTNITIFAPSDEALSASGVHASFESLLNNYAAAQGDMQQLVQQHIVKGVYYIDNLTTIANKSHGQNTVQNENNGKLVLTPVNSTAVQINHTANVVQPNILTDNGVMHVIDHVLSGGSQQQNQTQGGAGGGNGGQQPQPQQTGSGQQPQQSQ